MCIMCIFMYLYTFCMYFVHILCVFCEYFVGNVVNHLENHYFVSKNLHYFENLKSYKNENEPIWTIKTTI